MTIETFGLYCMIAWIVVIGFYWIKAVIQLFRDIYGEATRGN